MEHITKTPQEIKRIIQDTRHNKELLIYIAWSIIGLTVLLSYLGFSSATDLLLNEIEDELLWYDATGSMRTLLLMVSLFSGFSMIIVTIIVYLIQLYNYYAEQLSYAVKVSENNFPELYEKVKHYSYLLNLKKEPEVYVRQMNGNINAYSAWIPGKCFIQLNAEIVDLAYMEHKDLDTVSFVLAHEMGHIYLHHVQLIYNVLPILVSFVPIIGPLILYPLLSRAREYSCDRVAQALTDNKNEIECMMLLAAGRHIYKYIDGQRYIQDIDCKHSFIERFFRWMINLFSSHPIMPFRTKAILDPDKKSGRLV